MSRASNLPTLIIACCASLGLAGYGNAASSSALPAQSTAKAISEAGAPASTTTLATERSGGIDEPAAASAGLVPQAAATGSISAGAEVPGQADAFVNSVGIVTWFVYSTTAYTTRFPALSQLLIDSGVKHIRDSGPPYDQTYLRKMALFRSHGIRHSVGTPEGSTPAQITAVINAFGPNNVDMIEPQNEYDTYAKQDPNWVPHIIAQQKMIWKTVRSNRSFNGITVMGPAFANPNSYRIVGPLDAYEDAGNLHASFCNYNPGTNNGTVNLGNVTARARAGTKYKPIWTTETTYDDNTSVTHVCQTPDPVIARYFPRELAERWNAGEPRTYISQLVDTPQPGDPFGYLGLARVDGSPKPQYTAIKSMLSVLSDPGSPFRPTMLRYTVSGQTNYVHHTLLQKRDGTYVMMLWVEQPRLVSIYNPTQVPVPAHRMSLSVHGMTMATDYAYDISKWTLSPQRLAVNNGTVDLTVTDAISFVEFR